ncbi:MULTISPECIES: hydrogenase maturation protease [Clostridium]|uniref:hydrogenase maturation protease n=1 Tax=Clostridium TaxID=1485 RepID=UPI001FA80153|nr:MULTISPECIES: hydrogenase maturation protease [Clostridium]
MKFKVIAIGSTLMEDDGVGIEVLKEIRGELSKRNIETVIGETDLEYCISKIEEGDFVFFIDAVYYGKEPGAITVTELSEYRTRKYYMQHDINIVDLLRVYFKNVKGYVVGIEIEHVSIKCGLSDYLNKRIHTISQKVLREILARVS